MRDLQTWSSCSRLVGSRGHHLIWYWSWLLQTPGTTSERGNRKVTDAPITYVTPTIAGVRPIKHSVQLTSRFHFKRNKPRWFCPFRLSSATQSCYLLSTVTVQLHVCFTLKLMLYRARIWKSWSLCQALVFLCCQWVFWRALYDSWSLTAIINNLSINMWFAYVS